MKKKIMVGIPTKGQLSMATYSSLPRLRRRDVEIELHYNTSVVLDKARNTIIEHFLETDATHLLFVDSDIILPMNILTLLDRNKDAIAGLYGLWKDGMPVLNIFEKTVERGLYRAIKYTEKGKLLKIDACGLGCLLIKRKVLEKIPYPWCSLSLWDEEQRRMKYAEDFNLCENIKGAGFGIFADTGVECGHMIKADISEVTRYIGARLARNSLADELVEYTGKDKGTVMTLLRESPSNLALEWEKQKPKTKKEMETYYMNIPWYIYDLAYSNTLPRRMIQQQEIAENVHGKIIDYGGGIGSYLLKCWEKGHRDLTYLDLKGKTWDFAAWRFKKKKVSMVMVTPNHLKGKYDCILFIDVLEHLPNWKRTLRKIVNKHLNEGGKLFVTEAFDVDDSSGRRIHPQHSKTKKGELKKYLNKLLKGRKLTYYLWARIE